MSLYRQIFGKILLRSLNSPQINVGRNIKRWVAPTLNELYRRRVKLGPEPIQPRSSYLEWNYEAEIYAFGKRLGEEFDRTILKQALTHRSYINAEKEKNANFTEPPNNYKLIKEGNEIILNYLQEELKKKHPEDITTSLCDYLISEKILAHVAQYMGLKDIILTAEFPVENSTLSDTFKAVVAALKQSQDLKTAQLFIRDFLLSQLNGKEVYDIWKLEKPLEYLKNLLNGEEIEPRLCNSSAVSTILANYQIGLYKNRKLLGIGWGESIEIAKETAALDAIQRIHQK